MAEQGKGNFDPRELFAKLARIADIEIINTPPDRILLCGGMMGSVTASPGSARDFFYRELLRSDPVTAGKLILAEDVNDWMREGEYEELFTFEQHVAELSSVVVIFVESAGSIAELGAFSLLDGVADKLLVFMSENHYTQESFIKLGPISYLEKVRNRPPRIYPWLSTPGQPLTIEQQALLRDSIAEMLNDLKQALRSVRIHRSTTPFSLRDKMFAICDLLDRMLCLTVTEITKYVEAIGFTSSLREVKRLLFVLEKLGYIKKTKRGHETFYLVERSSAFLKYKAIESTDTINRQRMQFEIGVYYKETDGPRTKVIEATTKRPEVSQ